MIGRRTVAQGLRFARDLVRVSWALPEIEHARRSIGPRPYLAQLRARPPRSKRSETLGLAVHVVDGLVPGGRNCYRRALLQMRLDPELAQSSLYVGLRFEGDKAHGHAWVRGSEPSENYELIVEL